MLDWAGEYAIEWLVIMTVCVGMILLVTIHMIVVSAWRSMRRARWYRKAYYKVFK